MAGYIYSDMHGGLETREKKRNRKSFFHLRKVLVQKKNPEEFWHMQKVLQRKHQEDPEGVNLQTYEGEK